MALSASSAQIEVEAEGVKNWNKTVLLRKKTADCIHISTLIKAIFPSLFSFNIKLGARVVHRINEANER